MSVKSDNRSLYPYAVSVGLGGRLLACGPQYDRAAASAGDDAYSWRSNVDNDYAYVDDLIPPPAPHHQSPPPPPPPSRDHESTTAHNNNNAYAPQSVPGHLIAAGCLAPCRQYDVARQDRLRADVWRRYGNCSLLYSCVAIRIAATTPLPLLQRQRE